MRELVLVRVKREEEVSFFFFSSRRRHTRFDCDWSSDVGSSDLSTRVARPRRPRSRPLPAPATGPRKARGPARDRKSTRLNSSHSQISYAVFCLKKKKKGPSTDYRLGEVTERSHSTTPRLR